MITKVAEQPEEPAENAAGMPKPVDTSWVKMESVRYRRPPEPEREDI